METAVRRHLGFQRAGAIEGQFLGLRSAIKAVVEGKAPPSELVTRSGKLLLDLARASDDLKSLKVFDRRDVGKSTDQVEVVDRPRRLRAGRPAQGPGRLVRRDPRGSPTRGEPDDAASAMTDAYFTDFEPLERLLNVRRPQEVTPLESRFNAIRGRIGSGLKGPELASELDGLRGEVVAALARCRVGDGRVVRPGVRELAGDDPPRRGRGDPAPDDAGRPRRQGRPAQGRWRRSGGGSAWRSRRAS